jgi:hypothetical protein
MAQPVRPGRNWSRQDADRRYGERALLQDRHRGDRVRRGILFIPICTASGHWRTLGVRIDIGQSDVTVGILFRHADGKSVTQFVSNRALPEHFLSSSGFALPPVALS